MASLLIGYLWRAPLVANVIASSHCFSFLSLPEYISSILVHFMSVLLLSVLQVKGIFAIVLDCWLLMIFGAGSAAVT